ncbi:MAG: ankyrin repeat domain-containing protein [Epsilonproteobacteria bacterium]|nr:ankyrin repeat domain-containing protein [Campylobacterota bacterium]
MKKLSKYSYILMFLACVLYLPKAQTMSLNRSFHAPKNLVSRGQRPQHTFSQQTVVRPKLPKTTPATQFVKNYSVPTKKLNVVENQPALRFGFPAKHTFYDWGMKVPMFVQSKMHALRTNIGKRFFSTHGQNPIKSVESAQRAHQPFSAARFKGIDSLFNPEYRQLSLSHASLLAETDLARTLYRFTSREHNVELYRILHFLFYLNNDGVNFAQVQAKTEVASHLTPRMIGQLVGLVIEKNIDANAVLERMAVDIEQAMQVEGGGMLLRSEIEKRLHGLHGMNQIIAYDEGQFYKFCKQASELVDVIKKDNVVVNGYQSAIVKLLGGAKPKENDIHRVHLVKMLLGRELVKEDKDRPWTLSIVTANRDQLRSCEDAIKKYNTLNASKKNILKNLKEFVVHLRQVDQDKRFSCSLSQALLGVFFWSKKTTEDDVQEWMNGIRDMAPAALNSSFCSWKSTEQTEEQMLADQERVLDAIKQGQLHQLKAEDVASTLAHRQLLPKILPYCNQVSFKGKTFSDCGETALRNFFNMLFFDKKTQSYSKICEFEKQGFAFSTELKEFYVRFPTVALGQTKEAYEQWAELVSGIDGVFYEHTMYINGKPHGYELTANLKQEAVDKSLHSRVLDICKVIRHHVKAEQRTVDTVQDNIIGKLWKCAGHGDIEYQEREKIIGEKTVKYIELSLAPCVWTFEPEHYHFDLLSSKDGNQEHIHGSLSTQNSLLGVLAAGHFARGRHSVGHYSQAISKLPDSQKNLAWCLANPDIVFSLCHDNVSTQNSYSSQTKEPIRDYTRTMSKLFMHDSHGSCKKLFDRFVDREHHNGLTLLHRAVMDGDKELVTMLAALGADLNIKCAYGSAPLHHAAWDGNLEIAKCLLEQGADVNVKDKNGLTSLEYAAESGKTAMVDLLLSKGGYKSWRYYKAKLLARI